MVIIFRLHRMFYIRRRLEKIVSYYPLEYMMVETDGPWEFQEDVITHPRMIREVLKEISSIKKHIH